MNITYLHLFAFVDFGNMFVRHRSKQSTSELSVIATEMVSTTVFFPIKKLLQNEYLNTFCRCLVKTHNLHFFFQFDTGFFSRFTLTRFTLTHSIA